MKKRVRAIHRWGIFQLVQFWRKKWHENSLVVLLALLIGAVTALAAAALHVMVHRLADFSLWLTAAAKDMGGHGWLLVFLLLPMVGLTLSYLVQRYFGGHQYAKSLTPLVFALDRRQTFIPRDLQRAFGGPGRVGGAGGSERPYRRRHRLLHQSFLLPRAASSHVAHRLWRGCGHIGHL